MIKYLTDLRKYLRTLGRPFWIGYGVSLLASISTREG